PIMSLRTRARRSLWPRPRAAVRRSIPRARIRASSRFEKDADAEGQLDKTARLDSVKQEDYDTVFYPGGHGPMWDLAEDPTSTKLIESFLAAGKPVAPVCQARGVLRHVKTAAGKPLVEGKKVTGFTDGEEADVGPSGDWRQARARASQRLSASL